MSRTGRRLRADRARARTRQLLNTGCFDLGEGEFEVCLSAQQVSKLAPKKFLGSGTYASVFDRGDGTVIKFTSDATDASALLKAHRAGARWAPRVHAAFRLKERADSKWTPGYLKDVFALVVDKYRPFSLQRQEWAFRIAEAVQGEVFRGEDLRDPQVRGILQRPCKTSKCRRFVTELSDAVADLQDLGVQWEDIGGAQLGVDHRGELKILDLGETGDPQEAKKLEVLAGPRGCRWRAKRRSVACRR